ncbi:hypothetical protein pb186bvf_000869 [Paramecium bursaria]
MLTIDFFFKSEISFKNLLFAYILDKAKKKCIKKNLDIAIQILNKNITIEQLEDLINNQKVLIFVQERDGIENIIQGLSSIEGRIVYISDVLIKNYKTQERYDEGEINLNNYFDSNHSEIF